MSIAEARAICKAFLGRVPGALAGIPRDALIVGVLVLSSSLCFGLGYLAGLDTGRRTSEISIEPSSVLAPSIIGPIGKVVASRNGTKYYLPDCAGAARIAEANKVWFPSPSAASKAGYAPAANCAGL